MTSDKRFEERLKRIETRARTGAKSELLAGVCEGVTDPGRRRHKVAALTAGPAARSASLPLALLGALIGYLAFDVIRNLVGLDAIATLSGDRIADLVRAEPIIGGAAAVLSLCVLLAISSILRGRKAVRMMSFSCSALGAAIGAAIPAFA